MNNKFWTGAMDKFEGVFEDIKDFLREKRFWLFVIRLCGRNNDTINICGSWKNRKGIVKIDLYYDMDGFRTPIGYVFEKVDDKSGVIKNRFNSKISYEVRRVRLWR